MSQACCYIVATPIGNVQDITLRALEVLKSVDRIAAEDTRHSQRLLDQFAIKTPLISLHDHNETQRIPFILDRLRQGEQMALISDAGTPLISDPGYKIVSSIIEAGFPVITVPGACAAIAALSVSGLPTDRFSFVGFLPAKGAKRERALQQLLGETCTVVLYESVHRMALLLSELAQHVGLERQVVVARELTKRFETVYRGTAAEVKERFVEHPEQYKGEFVVMIAGAAEGPSADELEQRQLLSILLTELSVKQAVALAVKITGVSHRQLYSLALLIKQEG